METILIIDDSLVQAYRLKSILEDTYNITIAQTAADGLRHAATGTFSLILLDVIIPDMDGFMLLKKLQEQNITPRIPVILITSLSDVKHEEYGLTLGAVDYISKPFHPLIVKARVNTHIKLYQYRIEAEQKSLVDQMTGVANRRFYDINSALKWGEACRLGIPFSICMIDIDHFKIYNDTFGHPAGDKVIASIAKTASSYLQRCTDFFARYGGEEFVAFSLGDDADKIFNHIIALRQAIEDLHIPHNPSVSEWVTVSIGGITVFPKTGDCYETYLKLADRMLYDAKRFGKNQVVWLDDDMKQKREKKH